MCVGRGLRGPLKQDGCICVCVFRGVGLKTRGPDSAAAGQIAPQKVGHCTAHAHLYFVMEQARQGGVGANLCVMGSS